MLDWNNK